MTVSELIDAIRKPYVDALCKASAEHISHIEPACRKVDGTLAIDGSLNLPIRFDYVPKVGPLANEPQRVDSTTKIKFDQIEFKINKTNIQLNPFFWDWVKIEILGHSDLWIAEVLKPWFLEGFDIEDTLSKNSDGLYGVVHYISEIESIENGWKFTIDLGSSAGISFENLIFRLAEAGVAKIRVGELN